MDLLVSKPAYLNKYLRSYITPQQAIKLQISFRLGATHTRNDTLLWHYEKTKLISQRVVELMELSGQWQWTCKVDDNRPAGSMTIDCSKAIFCLICVCVITPCVCLLTKTSLVISKVFKQGTLLQNNNSCPKINDPF